MCFLIVPITKQGNSCSTSPKGLESFLTSTFDTMIWILSCVFHNKAARTYTESHHWHLRKSKERKCQWHERPKKTKKNLGDILPKSRRWIRTGWMAFQGGLAVRAIRDSLQSLNRSWPKEETWAGISEETLSNIAEKSVSIGHETFSHSFSAGLFKTVIKQGNKRTLYRILRPCTEALSVRFGRESSCDFNSWVAELVMPKLAVLLIRICTNLGF